MNVKDSVTSKDGTMIAFERTGTGPALILVDGALAFREQWGSRPLAAELSNAFTVYTYDRRGRGESTDMQPYTVEREIEDIEALIEDAGGSVHLFGFSSGSVLALKAAAKLDGKVRTLALLEPPFNPPDEASIREFEQFARDMAELLRAGKRGEAVEFFLGDMVPPDALEGMKRSPEWRVLEDVAPTLAYDNLVMGDGAVPAEARAAMMPTLVLVGGESPEFKHASAEALADALPDARRSTLEGQNTLVPPKVLAPVLTEFFER